MEKNKTPTKCPHHNIIIIVGSGKPIYWCGLFFDEKQCIFGDDKQDAGECGHYLFPKDTPKGIIHNELMKLGFDSVSLDYREALKVGMDAVRINNK